MIAYFRSGEVASTGWVWLCARLFATGLFVYGLSINGKAVIFSGFGTLLLIDMYTHTTA